jgi:hypothetical protein
VGPCVPTIVCGAQELVLLFHTMDWPLAGAAFETARP